MSVSLRKVLFSALLAGTSLGAASIAHAQSLQPPVCSPKQLDIKLSPQVESAPKSDLHRLAVEIQNRDQATCLLVLPAANFTPDNNKPWESALPPDSSQAALAFKQKSQQLAGGGVAHLLLAWSSAPIQVNGLIVDNCTGHDNMTLSPGFPGGPPEKPLLEVQHLQMQSCGQVWLSSLRLGPYVPEEPISKEWLERSQLPATAVAMKVAPVPAELKVAAPGAATLRADSDVEYLKGTLEFGFWGYFELFLKVPSPAITNCPFRSLRKREADGQTKIYLNYCENGFGRQLPQGTVKGIRLVIRDFGLLPERTGRIEYDVVSDVVQDGKPALAHASTELSIRNPQQPMLPTIDTSASGCQASQMKLTSPVVELGNHWDRPRAYAPSGQKWEDGKVFELTNVSSESCVLGGVPEFKILNPPEVTSGSMLAIVCRNCSSSLFKSRESRWIDLRPNESAHFIVARTVLDADFQCNVMGGLEMSLPGDKQQIHLPFEVGYCGQLRVTAWRAGRYDSDPMNIQYDRAKGEREQRLVAAAAPLPSECTADVSADTGRPVMFRSERGLIWGLSTKSVPYGETIPMLLWVCNTTDRPLPVMTCGDIDRFWLEGFDVFDTSGQRVVSLREENEKKIRESGGFTEGGGCLSFCTRNFPIDIPPYSSVHATFSNPNYDFVRDLRTYYSLPPGRYFIVPSERGRDCEPSRRTLPGPKNGLLVVVEEL
jgi:hypothetical protein